MLVGTESTGKMMQLRSRLKVCEGVHCTAHVNKGVVLSLLAACCYF